MTTCTRGRQPLFGTVADGRVALSSAGRIASGEWERTAVVRPSVVLDAFVVMPDHVHLLFGIVPRDADDCPGDDDHPGDDHHRGGIPAVFPYPGGARDGGPIRRFGQIQAGTVASVMRQYKSVVTKRVGSTLGRETGPVWQRGFHDRVVRTDREADAVRRYVAANPARWDPTADRADGHRA